MSDFYIVIRGGAFYGIFEGEEAKEFVDKPYHEVYLIRGERMYGKDDIDAGSRNSDD